MFDDIVIGSNGNCATCSAGVGYDTPTGLGTPQVDPLLLALGGANAVAAVPAPIVSPVHVHGVAGQALSFSVAFTSPDALTWSLAGAPAGIGINSAGQMSWSNPIAGTYTFQITATDNVSGQSGSSSATLTIASAAAAPQLVSATVAGQSGHALSYQVGVSALNPLTFSLTGAPSGMTIDAAGLLQWPSPVAGNSTVTVRATDTVTGLTDSATLQIRISAGSAGPHFGSSSALSAVAGKAWSQFSPVNDPAGGMIHVLIKGVPAGMSIVANGPGLLFSWKRPIAGTYTLLMTATDAAGLSAQSSLTLTVSP